MKTSKRLTAAQIRDLKTKAMHRMTRRVAHIASMAVDTARDMDNLFWALTSEAMPKDSWAIFGRPAGEFFRWLDDYRKHVDSMSPRKRASYLRFVKARKRR